MLALMLLFLQLGLLQARLGSAPDSLHVPALAMSCNSCICPSQGS